MSAGLKTHILQTDMTLEAQERKTNKVMGTLMAAAKKNHKVESLGSCSAREAWCLHQGQGSRGQNVGGAQELKTHILQTDMTVEAQDRETNKVMTTLMKAAKTNHDVELLALAVRVKLAAFTKVKAAMDKMLAELKSSRPTSSSGRCKARGFLAL